MEACHLLVSNLFNNLNCSNLYKNNIFTISAKGVLDSMRINTYKPNICKNKLVYDTRLTDLL